MIITCPECATRYDVDDDRFEPDGRSVRCTACGESWFVPAPAVMEDMVSLGREDEVEARKHGKAGQDADDAPADDEANISAFGKRGAAAEDDEDDRLFDNVVADDKTEPSSKADETDRGGASDEKSAAESSDDAEEDAPRWKRGRKFLMDENDDEDEEERRPFFALRPKAKKDEDEAPRRSFFSRFDRDKDDDEDALSTGRPDRAHGDVKVEADDEDDRAADARDEESQDDDGALRAERRDETRAARDDERNENNDDDFSAHASVDDRRDEPEDDADEAFETDRAARGRIVDADWEAVDDNDDAEERPRGFGRRIREERRRATAVTRVEPIDPRYFDDEFFEALRVHPRELEKALRKARRRAEAREKNRMTPIRALGWSAWIGVVAATIFAVVVYRDEIVSVAPGAADAYQVFGVETTPHGLAIENVRHRLAMSTAGPTIEITGQIRNVSEEAVSPPLLQAEALGPDGELLSRWTFSVSEADVLAGGLAPFITRAPAPNGVVEVALSFAPASPVQRKQ